MKMISRIISLSAIAAILGIAITISAQMKSRSSNDNTTPAASEKAPVPAPTKTPAKKNERPTDPTDNNRDPAKKNQTADDNSAAKQDGFPNRYEFSQPNFIVSHVVIEYDDSGKGKITFERSDSDGSFTDPIQLSAGTLDRINAILKTLNFMDSTEVYQSPIRDYGHLGNYTITINRDNKMRSVKYNWSENLDARSLTAEYRKITEQYVWLFDMDVSRQNQPLESPSLMDRLDSLLQRNEIADPSQILPVLKELSNDERLPLIARTHANKMIKSLEKKPDK